MHDRINPLRVAIAEDAALFRDGLILQLESGGIVVTDACGSAEELMPRLRMDAPDIVCLDIRMPPTNTDEGIRAAAEIRREFPDMGILVLTMYPETEYAAALTAIGSTSIGYLVKERVGNIESLLDSLNRIACGGCVIDPDVVAKLLHKPPHQEILGRLSKGEKSVLQLMAEGHSNARIAQELSLTVRTIESNISTIFAKLDLPESRDANRRVKAVITWLRAS